MSTLEVDNVYDFNGELLPFEEVSERIRDMTRGVFSQRELVRLLSMDCSLKLRSDSPDSLTFEDAGFCAERFMDGDMFLPGDYYGRLSSVLKRAFPCSVSSDFYREADRRYGLPSQGVSNHEGLCSLGRVGQKTGDVSGNWRGLQKKN